MVGVVGPVRGSKPTWKQAVLASVTSTTADTNECKDDGVTSFQCQSEGYRPLLCITYVTAQHSPDPRNEECLGDADGVANGIQIKNIKFDGQKALQPAPRPEDCLALENAGTGVCNATSGGYPYQSLVRVQDGDNHIIEGNEFTNSSGRGLALENTSGVVVQNNVISKIGCVTDPTGTSVDGDCGDNWKQVPSIYSVSVSGWSTGRTTNGYGVLASAYNSNVALKNNTVGFATKMGLELLGSTNTDGTIESNVLDGSSIVANSSSRPTIKNNVVKNHLVKGEEGLNTGFGISLVGATGDLSGPVVVEGNTITNTMSTGIRFQGDSQDVRIYGNKITDSCQTTTYNTSSCSSVSIDTLSTSSSDVDFVENLIDVKTGKEKIGISLSGPGSSAMLALNRIKGGSGSQLTHAVRVDSAAGFDLRYNVLDWDTDIATSAIDLVSVTGGTIQADAFSDQTDSSSGYTGAGAATKITAAGLTEGTHYDDCELEVDAGTAPAACYDTFTIAYAPDTQNQWPQANPTLADIDSGYFDELIQWVIDTRECFHTGKVKGGANPASNECFNVKYFAGVGDISSTASQGSPAGQATANTSLLYQRLGTLSNVPVPWLAPPGNHDCVPGESCSVYQTYFDRSVYQSFTPFVELTSLNDTDIAQFNYPNADDLAQSMRFKVLDRWWLTAFLPFNVSSYSSPWRNWVYDKIDNYPDDFVFYIEHSLVGDTSPRNGVCDNFGFTGTQQFILGQGQDGSNVNVMNSAYQQFYSSASGHVSPFEGWFCRNLSTNNDGDSYLWTGANWQGSDDYITGSYGDGWMVLLRHDVGADTVFGTAFSPLAASGAGAFATDVGFDAGTNESNEPCSGCFQWTENINLSTR